MVRFAISALLTIALPLWASTAQAQVAYETSAASTNVTFVAAGETETFSFNAGTGANRALAVFVGWRDRDNTISGITYNGVAMTAQAAKVVEGTIAAGQVWCLAGPASGANNIAVTMGVGTDEAQAQISAWVANGVDQTTPCDGYAGNSGNASTANIVSSVTVSSATNDLVAAFHFTYNESAVITSSPTGYTERQDTDNASGLSTAWGDQAGAASVATSSTWSNGAYLVRWVAMGVNFNAAAAAGGCPGMLLRGVCDE